MVSFGVAVTSLPKDVDRPVIGDHWYDSAPVAVRVVLEPRQIVLSDTVATTFGMSTFCVISICADAVHPLSAVAVTMYMPASEITFPTVVVVAPLDH